MVKKFAPLHWQTFEYEAKERSADWFWAVGIITLGVAITSIILKNVLFAFVILLGGFSLSMYAARPPKEIDIVLDDEGVRIDKFFYPYRTLESFWIETVDNKSQILIKSQRLIMPNIVIPINTAEVETEEIDKYFFRYLPEVFHSESVFHKWMEYLGF